MAADTVAGMTWVKGGGGAGQGFYGQGLGRAVSNAAPASRPAARPEAVVVPAGVDQPVDDPVDPPAYRPQKWIDVLDARILLDVLASYVNEGGEAEMAMIYPDTLESFGADSKHFTAACRGEQGAGAHYQRSVAGGRYRNGEVH